MAKITAKCPQKCSNWPQKWKFWENILSKMSKIEKIKNTRKFTKMTLKCSKRPTKWKFWKNSNLHKLERKCLENSQNDQNDRKNVQIDHQNGKCLKSRKNTKFIRKLTKMTLKCSNWPSKCKLTPKMKMKKWKY